MLERTLNRALWIVLVGCHSNPTIAPDATADVACDGDQQLIGSTDRLHVQIEYNGAPAVLLLDTGSPTTFFQEPLGSPDPVANAATFQIGCDAVVVDGRPEAPEGSVNGMPSVGTFGVDRLLAATSEIDLVDERLSYANVAGTTGWMTAPYDVVSGLVLPHVALDGQPMRLMLDTGSQDTLWLGQAAQPGDVAVDTTDAQGNVVHLFAGTAMLTIGNMQRTIPVLRAPSFPYLEQTVAALGGDVQGLLGLSSLGDAFVLDGMLHVEPQLAQ
jgi:hypothetical protein